MATLEARGSLQKLFRCYVTLALASCFLLLLNSADLGAHCQGPPERPGVIVITGEASVSP